MHKIVLSGACSVLALISTPAFAQDEEAERPANSGDIIVTANRVETLLSKTPIALTAIGGEDLAESGITNPTQLEEAVPNLSIVRGNGLQITIRGVTSTDGTEKGDPSAAFNLNGIYIARPQAQEVAFYDIERVEVLRGPQGTLYGRNSTAGVINVISTRPKFDEFSGSVDASYGSFNHFFGTAAVNIPVSDTFAIRAAANVDRRDSFLIDGNDTDGVSLDPFKDSKSVRLSALFEPSTDFSIYLVGDYSWLDGTTTNSVETFNFFPDQLGNVALDRPTYVDRPDGFQRTLAVAQNQQTERNNTDRGVTGELNYNLGFATFTYLGSYRESDRSEISNFRNGPLGADFVGDYWQTSHEARLAFGGDGPLSAQVGGYYFKEESYIALFLNNLVGPNTRFGFPQGPTIAENKSVFGQATYEIVPDLRITGGVRYSNDFKSRDGATVIDVYDSVGDSRSIGNFIVRNTLQQNIAARTFDKVTWRAGIDYDSALGLIYASVSTGYKAGGFNDGCEIGTGDACELPANALYYDPETLTAYEAGFKFRLSDMVSLNGTVFHYDYKNLQLSQLANVCGGQLCQVTTNAAAAKVDGVELDTSIFPMDGLTLTFALNYLDARYDDFVPTPGSDFSGRPLARSPEWSGRAAVNYTFYTNNDASFDINLGTRFSSEADLTDLANQLFFYQPGFTKTDLSLTYTGAEERFYLGAYIENIENNITLTGVTGGATGSATFADPRTFGVRGGVKF